MIKMFLGVLGLLLLDAFWLEQYFLEWNTFDLAKDDKKKLKAIQLSDLHLEKIKWVHKSLAKRINKELPDVLFLTGDSITKNSRIPLLKEFLSLIDQNIQKVAILGNKEYSGRVDIKELRKALNAYNCTLLINESFVLKTKLAKVNILGLDDLVFGTPDFESASKEINNHCS